MTRLDKIILALLVAFLLPLIANAAEDNPFTEISQAELAEIAKAQEDILNDLAAQLDQLKAQQTPHPAVLAAAREVEIAYYKAQTQQNKTIAALLLKQEDIFLYQDIASYTLLVMVVVITMAGIVFSAKELNRSMATAPQTANTVSGADRNPDNTNNNAGGETSTAPQPTPNNIKIGFSGVQITSALTGITVLTLSLAFLYLFLKEVYQIEAVRVPHIEDQTQSPDKQ